MAIPFFKFYFIVSTTPLMDHKLSIGHQEKNVLAMRVKKLLSDDRGLLAVDEQPLTIEPKFTACGIANTPENRAAFRSCLFSTPQLEKYIGGAILNEETLSQTDASGKRIIEYLLEKGIEVGLKLDKGLMDFNESEKISVGLEDLENRMQKYKDVTFCKWRSLFTITENTPTQKCVEENCAVLCRYALMAQKNGMVPILEPEISLDGCYTKEHMVSTVRLIYSTLFLYASKMGLFVPGMIVKSSFVSAGKDCPVPASAAEVGAATVSAITDSIPMAIGGIVFLSGGHSSEDSFDFLSSVHANNPYKDLLFSFSFCRALTSGALQVWEPRKDKDEIAQEAFLDLLKKCKEANKRI